MKLENFSQAEPECPYCMVKNINNTYCDHIILLKYFDDFGEHIDGYLVRNTNMIKKSLQELLKNFKGDSLAQGYIKEIWDHGVNTYNELTCEIELDESAYINVFENLKDSYEVASFFYSDDPDAQPGLSPHYSIDYTPNPSKIVNQLNKYIIDQLQLNSFSPKG